jgi:hypothetical protein
VSSASWVAVFLSVIALSALLQAAFVVGLAVASRIARRRLQEMEERIEPQLVAGLAQVNRLSAALSAASAQARGRALRLDVATARLADDLADLGGTTADRVAGMAEGTAERLAGRMAASSEDARRPFLRALAVVRGLQRGLAVWRDEG